MNAFEVLQKITRTSMGVMIWSPKMEREEILGFCAVINIKGNRVLSKEQVIKSCP